MSATLNAGSFRSDDTLYGASRTLKSYLRSILMHKHGIRLIPKVRWHRAGFRRYWRRKQPAYTACKTDGQNQAFVRKAANVAGSDGKRFPQNYGMHLHAHATGHASRDAAV